MYNCLFCFLMSNLKKKQHKACKPQIPVFRVYINVTRIYTHIHVKIQADSNLRIFPIVTYVKVYVPILLLSWFSGQSIRAYFTLKVPSIEWSHNE